MSTPGAFLFSCGRFMVFGTDPSWLSTAFETGNPNLKEIVIEARVVSTIKIELRDSGITEFVIYPGLDGLGREMNQLFEEWK